MSSAYHPVKSTYSPLSGNDFVFTKRDVYRVLGFVIFFHVILFILFSLGLPDFRFNKRPDITIEIGAAPPASSGPVNQIKPTATPTQKEAPKEKMPPPSKEKDALAIPVPAQTSQSSAQPVASSSSNIAAAPTADADYKAAYLQNPKPPYPPLAFKMRVEGRVVVLAEVLADGRAGQVSLAQSSGNELLDQSALTTIKQWKFTPARKDGVIITQAVRIPIIFSLKNR